MKNHMRRICAVVLSVSVYLFATNLHAQDSAPQQPDGFSILGSVILSILYVPVKLATCVGTQAGAAVAYTATYGVAGNFDGGTNGKDIGEAARRTCTGDWVITPEQVKKDYQ